MCVYKYKQNASLVLERKDKVAKLLLLFCFGAPTPFINQGQCKTLSLLHQGTTPQSRPLVVHSLLFYYWNHLTMASVRSNGEQMLTLKYALNINS